MIEEIVERLNEKKQRYESYAATSALDKEIYMRHYYRAQGIEEALQIINEYR